VPVGEFSDGWKCVNAGHVRVLSGSASHARKVLSTQRYGE
jgi:hypothetical protein